MLRRFAAFVFALVLCASLGACGQVPGGSSQAQPSSQASSQASQGASSAAEPSVSSSSSAQESSQASSSSASTAADGGKDPEDVDYGRGYHHAKIKVKGYGNVIVELHPDFAPKTVKAFCKLVDEGYYDGMCVYWVLNDMYVRMGDRSGETAGKHVVKGEYKEGGYKNGLSLKRGALAMSRTGSGRNSDASSLVVALSDLSYLDGKYAVFGKITKGMEVFDEICARVNNGDAKSNIAVGKDGEILKKKKCPVIKSIRMVD